jgi:ubiquinone biosynthesis protein
VQQQRSRGTDEWTEFFAAFDFGSLVPEGYARYRRAVADGLDFFLDNLAPARSAEILADQLSVPISTSIEERLVGIARYCPVLHKLGQVLARDRRLPSRFRRLLQGLESLPSALDIAGSRRLAEKELGPLAHLGIAITEPPLAEASVAVVVPFTSLEGTAGEPANGVLKLLKPGVEEKLAEELSLLQRVGALLDDRCEAYALPHIDYEHAFAQVRRLLAGEVCLEREQQHMVAASAAYAGLPSAVVPELYPFSTPRLTAMQRIIGTKVTDATLSAADRRKIAGTIVETLLALPLWSDADQAMFHADPHAGNLFATEEGQLAILDWSLVGLITKADRVQLTQILLGAFTLDAGRIRVAINELAQGHTDALAVAGVVDRHLACLTPGAWPGLGWLTELMDDAVTQAACRFRGDLLMFRKVLQTLEGVVADVSAECRPDRVLIGSMLRQLALEWGQRAFAPPFSRHFATNVSTLDLTQLLVSAPIVGSLQWMNLQSAWLRGASSGGAL